MHMDDHLLGIFHDTKLKKKVTITWQYIYIYTFQPDTQCSWTDCLLILSCQQSVQLHCVSRWNVYILQKMIHGTSNVKLHDTCATANIYYHYCYCYYIFIVIINLWTKGLGVTHPVECSVALEIPLSLISSSTNISPSFGIICILFWFQVTIFMYCYQYHWHFFPFTTFKFGSKSLAFYFVFCLVTWLPAMKYGFLSSGLMWKSESTVSAQTLCNT